MRTCKKLFTIKSFFNLLYYFSNLAIYGEINRPPTFTKFKFFETFNGNALLLKATNKSSKFISLENERDTGVSLVSNDAFVNTGFVHYLEKAIWYIALFNDNDDIVTFTLNTEFRGMKDFLQFREKTYHSSKKYFLLFLRRLFKSKLPNELQWQR